MTDDEAVALATQALTHWGVAGPPPRLIKNRENAVFEVTAPDGSRAALRIHRAGYQSKAGIRSELDLMFYLNDAGFQAPCPIPTTKDDLMTTVGAPAQVANMLTWVDGVPMGESEKPLNWPAATQRQLHRTLGAEIARLHNIFDGMALPPGFTRPAWDIDGFLGDNPVWGRFWQNPGLTPEQAEIVQQARAKARVVLAEFQANGGDFGLIHADPIRENVLVNGTDIAIIDFDDCGFGFRMYDLATSLYRSLNEPLIDALMAELRHGYRTVRPLPDAHWQHLPLFLMLRSFALLGWIVPRMQEGAGPERNLEFVSSAVTLAQTFLKS
jgi:Ser/Thr protein kinase RdoA (MazF antagonist)